MSLFLVVFVIHFGDDFQLHKAKGEYMKASSQFLHLVQAVDQVCHLHVLEPFSYSEEAEEAEKRERR